jgi:hypothetical protein
MTTAVRHLGLSLSSLRAARTSLERALRVSGLSAAQATRLWNRFYVLDAMVKEFAGHVRAARLARLRGAA